MQMSGQTLDMPHRQPTEDAATPGGRPGNQSGGDWENQRPTPELLRAHLGGMQYPISKADLVQNMRWQKAPLPVIYFLEKLPEREFVSAEEIVAAVAEAG
jgi:hypothetical protein